MKTEFIEAVVKGVVLKSNTFVTDRGKYAIDIVAHDDTLYFFKSKDGKIVECINLSEKAKGEF